MDFSTAFPFPRIVSLSPSPTLMSTAQAVFTVGMLNDYKYTFSRDEVSEVFTVPVEFFMNEEPEIYEVSSQIMPDEDFPYHLIQGGRNYKWRRTKVIEMFYRYESHIIWGMTARIINAFIESLK